MGCCLSDGNTEGAPLRNSKQAQGIELNKDPKSQEQAPSKKGADSQQKQEEEEAPVAVRRAKEVGRKVWFERLFEFRESVGGPEEYLMTQGQFKYNPKTGILTVKDVDPGLQFKAGHFLTPSLQELREKAAQDEREIARVLGGGAGMTVREEIGDVSAMHTKEENRYSLFQAASQFNALEHDGEYGIPEHGLTCYSYDKTQGPACATACAPGLVVRNYFAFGPEPNQGQTEHRQIENMSDVEKVLNNEEKRYFSVQSGYTLSNDEVLEPLGDALKDGEIKEAIRKNLRIGVQQDTEVVAWSFGSRRYEDAEPGVQLVTQAYCSAISVSYSGCKPELWEPFARLVLEAAYEATFHVAVQNAIRNEQEPGARKVFLTALGGGVFGNDMKWITDAMWKAFEKFRKYDLEVIIVSFGESTPELKALETVK